MNSSELRGSGGRLDSCSWEAWDQCEKGSNREPDLYGRGLEGGGGWCVCGERVQDKTAGVGIFGIGVGDGERVVSALGFSARSLSLSLFVLLSSNLIKNIQYIYKLDASNHFVK